MTGVYDPGVRVRFGVQCRDWFSDLSYLYFCSEENISAEIGDFDQMIMAGSPQFQQGSIIAVKSSDQFRYQNVDGRFGYCFCPRSCLDA
ncbi:MAG: hypothetical protein WAM28_07165, partial [Chlamydiales bacterium]